MRGGPRNRATMVRVALGAIVAAACTATLVGALDLITPDEEVAFVTDENTRSLIMVPVPR